MKMRFKGYDSDVRNATIEECAKRIERMSNPSEPSEPRPGTVRFEVIYPAEYAAGWHAACARAAKFVRELNA